MDQEIPLSDLTPEAAEVEINEHMGDFQGGYWRKDHPDHDKVFERVKGLHEVAYPAPGQKKGINTQTEAQTEEAQALEASESERALREEWKEQYDGNVEMARGGYGWFAENLIQGDEELESLIESLGNKRPVIKLFHRLGVLMKEAQERGEE